MKKSELILKNTSDIDIPLFFKHIYIQKEAFEYPLTKKIISGFPQSETVRINDYRDVFNRQGQDFCMQNKYKNLIIGVKKTNLIYPGSDLCQDFGNAKFYYASNVLNCLYDCSYCYLKGRYKSANILCFVNIDDYFKEIEKLLKLHPVYLTLSFESDIMAFENKFGFCSKWFAFAKKNHSLTIEIRTKSCTFNNINSILPSHNIILAWTLSPEKINNFFEKGAPSLKSRLASAYSALLKGWNVRLCFDPLIYIKDFKNTYDNFIGTVFNNIPPERIYDIGTGVFRMPKNIYLKMAGQGLIDYTIYKYTKCIDNVYTYPDSIKEKMLGYIKNEISKHFPLNKVFDI